MRVSAAVPGQLRQMGPAPTSPSEQLFLKALRTIAREEARAAAEEAVAAAVDRLTPTRAPWMTTADVCREFGIQPRTLRDWIKSKGFPAPMRLGKFRGRVRYSRAEVEAWRASSTA